MSAPIQVKNGQYITDPRLTRIFELDWRSLEYPVDSQLEAVPVYRPRSYTWSVDHWFDQGQEGACVGFAFAHELAARPQEVVGVDDQFARNVYLDAQRIDPWPGGAYPGASPFYEGTSVLAGAKIIKNKGYYDSYYWAMSTEELARGLAYFGPCVLGINWYEGMFYPDVNGFLRPSGRLAGGHAILAHSVKIVYKSWIKWWDRTWRDVDWQKSYIIVWNSWGPRWGDKGKAKISFADMDRLLSENGEAVFPSRTMLREVA